jgi:hypothetical protein
MTRHRITLVLTAAALFALTACGATPAATAADVADEAKALQAVGLEVAPAPAPSASPEHTRGKGKHKAARRYLRKNTLHGEMTVQGKDGVKKIVVQRGTVTAVDAKTVSVKSSDGFALTWTLGDKVRVVHDHEKAEIGEVKAGAEVGVAGIATTARLIVLQ